MSFYLKLNEVKLERSVLGDHHNIKIILRRCRKLKWTDRYFDPFKLLEKRKKKILKSKDKTFKKQADILKEDLKEIEKTLLKEFELAKTINWRLLSGLNLLLEELTQKRINSEKIFNHLKLKIEHMSKNRDDKTYEQEDSGLEKEEKEAEKKFKEFSDQIKKESEESWKLAKASDRNSISKYFHDENYDTQKIPRLCEDIKKSAKKILKKKKKHEEYNIKNFEDFRNLLDQYMDEFETRSSALSTMIKKSNIIIEKLAHETHKCRNLVLQEKIVKKFEKEKSAISKDIKKNKIFKEVISKMKSFEKGEKQAYHAIAR